MKEISAAVSALTQPEINSFENNGNFSFSINSNAVELTLDDVEIISEDIPGWQVANDGRLTVALDITVTDDLKYEGIAREFVNRIQNIRKESGFDVTDKITVLIEDLDLIREAVNRHSSYIGSQTLATAVSVVPSVTDSNVREIDIDEVIVRISVKKD
jgi:isoleucyl-tRNA synthetase